uniref:Uncharacterized protein n=1 Tax=Physcomitrium patens TaxID=3218 RepID=A0A2K1KET0_PHYPA|nr:hypothetical protein PHYPA_008656 [Physcomitrium patens]
MDGWTDRKIDCYNVAVDQAMLVQPDGAILCRSEDWCPRSMVWASAARVVAVAQTSPLNVPWVRLDAVELKNVRK